MLNNRNMKTLVTITLFIAYFYAECALCEEDWEPIHREIYSRDGARISNADMAKKLAQLYEIYSKKTDELSLGKKKRIGRIIFACKDSLSQCNENDLDEIADTIKYNSQFLVSLVPYLKWCQSNLVKKCEDPNNTDAIIRAQVDSLKDKGAEAVELMKDVAGFLEPDDVETQTMNIKAIAHGALEFLTTRTAKQPISMYVENLEWARRDKFKKEYHRIFDRVCGEIDKRFHYIAFLNKENNPELSSEYANYWFYITTMCYKLTNYDEYYKIAYRMLEKESNAHPVKHKLANLKHSAKDWYYGH